MEDWPEAAELEAIAAWRLRKADENPDDTASVAAAAPVAGRPAPPSAPPPPAADDAYGPWMYDPLSADDARALATLKLLADFSQRTQVIVFTHHEHLCDLAQRHLTRDQLFVHTL